MDEKKEPKDGFVGGLAIFCLLAILLFPPKSKAKSGSSLEGEREVPEWEIQIKKKPSRFDSERQKPLSQDSVVKVAVKKIREKLPPF